MQFVAKVKQNMANMSDEALLQARERIKKTYNFYWKIIQEKNIDLTKPRGKSAKENCNEINSVGLKIKAEIEKRNINLSQN